MVQISKADYEAVEVVCEHCGEECVLNRREDFTHTGPYASENAHCPYCRREFRIMSDTVNPPYELFVFSAKEHFRRKRYMLSVATMAQAWELFFAMFADAWFLYRPFFSSGRSAPDVARLNHLQKEMDHALQHCTFAPLRNLVINTVAREIAPRTLDDAESAVKRIESNEMCKKPPDSIMLTVGDPGTQDILRALLNLGIGELRNKVLHHQAYRPLRVEVERCLGDELLLLYRTKRALAVGSFDEFAAGIV